MSDAVDLNGMIEIEVDSTIDGSPEKNLFYFPDGGMNVPLLVGLHTWSFDRFNQIEHMLPACKARGWALLLPEFRGPNAQKNPRAHQACASRLARQDILDAVAAVRSDYSIDGDRIFLLGGSGGGHMALMMAAAAPVLWTAVSAWVPITDLTDWHARNPNYAAHIEACIGGRPGESAVIDEAYRARSPITHVRAIAQANVSIHHGRYDASVPYDQSWRLAVELEKCVAKRFFFDIFDGGHELRYDVALAWFDEQAKRAGLNAAELTG